MSKKEQSITRKEFLQKSCAGLTGLMALDLLKEHPLAASPEDRPPLEIRTLGRSGIKATVLGYGASRSMEPALLLGALDHGMNFVDTGRSYFNGNNERMVGEALKGIRKDVVIQSKMRVRLRGETGGSGEAIQKAMQASLEASLEALQTDYIDIMLLHSVSDVRVLENETVMEFLSAAKQKGIIRAHGFSCHNVIEVLESANRTKFYDIVMLPFNHKGSYVHMLSGRSSEWDQPRTKIELEKAHQNKLGVVAMKTCSAGPVAFKGEPNPSIKGALKWVLDHAFVGTMAVAMSNMDEIVENTAL
jgi:aryl-alcohol dehydrogenase-like predicted oxidoreductase